jgi:putative membrane protein
MSVLIKFLLTAVAAIIASYLLPGVSLDGFLTALILAVLLGLLNVTVKPILLILTIPATVLTFGLFILVINAFVILIADAILPGFEVANFWWALLFSLLLWLTNSLLNDITQKRDQQQ